MRRLRREATLEYVREAVSLNHPFAGKPAPAMGLLAAGKGVDPLILKRAEPLIHAGNACLGCFPVNAPVCHRDAVFQTADVIRYRLVAGVDVALDHQPDDIPVAFKYLPRYFLRNAWLQVGVLAGIVMAAVDHDVLTYPGFTQRLLTTRNVGCIVVGFSVSASQHDMTVVVAGCPDSGYMTEFIDAEEDMRVTDGLERVNGDTEAAVGAVLEAHGTGKSAGHDTVCL